MIHIRSTYYGSAEISTISNQGIYWKKSNAKQRYPEMHTEVRLHEVEIPIRALKTASLYEIRVDGFVGLVDSGMNESTIKSLNSSGLDVRNVDLLMLTHLHVDHVGGSLAIQELSGCKIAMGEQDYRILVGIAEDPDGFKKRYVKRAIENGFPLDLESSIVKGLPFSSEARRFLELKVDTPIKGDGTLGHGMSYLSVPGHSPGSVAFVIQEQGIMFAGDHILQRITPNIGVYEEEMDMLGEYLKSLEKVRLRNFKACLPGHGGPFDGIAGRIDEIEKHHSHRLKEIEDTCVDWSSAFSVASRITWNRGRQLADMNEMERNFAFGEALSHLIHLSRTERVSVKNISGIIKFKRRPAQN
jgi:glyoxylase-like metal-dependent hydrolase (beta-lactamase superfamily II)